MPWVGRSVYWIGWDEGGGEWWTHLPDRIFPSSWCRLIRVMVITRSNQQKSNIHPQFDCGWEYWPDMHYWNLAGQGERCKGSASPSGRWAERPQWRLLLIVLIRRPAQHSGMCPLGDHDRVYPPPPQVPCWSWLTWLQLWYLGSPRNWFWATSKSMPRHWG